MRKLLAAALLSLFVSAVSTAKTIDPIKPVPKEQFKPYDITDIINNREISLGPIPTVVKPKAKPIVKLKPATRFTYAKEVSWYGPGFYGKRTACGHKYTTKLLGVAHRSLPCGTLVTFRNPANGRVATVPVIDRGPYVKGRIWDLSGGLCVKLDHCYTGPIQYKVVK